MADGENPENTEVQETTDAFDGDFDPERYKAAMNKKNSENASLRARLKDAEEKAAKLAEIEKAETDKNKSSEERFAELSSQNKELQRKVWLTDVREEFGLTAAQAKRLVGNSFDELKADAEDFKKTVLGASKDDDTVEYDEDAAEAELSPFGNRRNVTDVSRSRATGGAAEVDDLDVDALVDKIRSGKF